MIFDFLRELFGPPKDGLQEGAGKVMKAEVKTVGKNHPPPTILISHEAFRDIKFILESSPDHEIGWLGTVENMGDNEYLIKDIFIFEQEAGPGHCDLDAKEIGKFCYDLIQKDAKNKEVVPKLLFWGHVHPGTFAEPSSQDDAQMKAFSDNPYFIRGIFTRGGKWTFTFFDYENKREYHRCVWKLSFYDPKRKEEIMSQIKEKVKIKGE